MATPPPPSPPSRVPRHQRRHHPQSPVISTLASPPYHFSKHPSPNDAQHHLPRLFGNHRPSTTNVAIRSCSKPPPVRHSTPVRQPTPVCWTCSLALPLSTSRFVPTARTYLFRSFSLCSLIKNPSSSPVVSRLCAPVNRLWAPPQRYRRFFTLIATLATASSWNQFVILSLSDLAALIP